MQEEAQTNNAFRGWAGWPDLARVRALTNNTVIGIGARRSRITERLIECETLAAAASSATARLNSAAVKLLCESHVLALRPCYTLHITIPPRG